MISALFVRKDSIYKTLDVDSWDVDRDALKWTGKNSIIAHPPCRAWGQLSHFAKPRLNEKELAIWAIHKIRIVGGVLEHPRASKLWPYLNLPLGSKRDSFGGFTLSVNQSWWGHKCRKSTLLYVCGCSPKQIPAHPLNFTPYTHIMGTPKNSILKELPVNEREKTPVDLALYLIEIAKICNNLNIKHL